MKLLSMLSLIVPNETSTREEIVVVPELGALTAASRGALELQ